MIVHDIQQRSPEWFAWRKTGQSASTVPVIIGESPYETAFELWARKCADNLPENERLPFLAKHGVKPRPNLDKVPAVIRGKLEEKNVNREYEAATGQSGGLPLCIQSETYPWLLASLDWYKDAVAEFKVPSIKVFDDVAKRGTRSSAYLLYRSQAQAQMIAAMKGGVLPKGYLVFYSPEQMRVLIFEITVTTTRMKKIIKAVEKFHKNVVNVTPPEKDPATDTYVPETDSEIQIWTPHCENIKGIDCELAFLKERENALKEQRALSVSTLSDAVKDSGFKRGVYMGVDVLNSDRKGMIDYKVFVETRLPKLLPIELEPYRKEGIEAVKVTSQI